MPQIKISLSKYFEAPTTEEESHLLLRLRGVHTVDYERCGVALQLFGKVKLEGLEESNPLPQSPELGHLGDDRRSYRVYVPPEEVAARNCPFEVSRIYDFSHNIICSLP